MLRDVISQCHKTFGLDETLLNDHAIVLAFMAIRLTVFSLSLFLFQIAEESKHISVRSQISQLTLCNIPAVWSDTKISFPTF